MGRLAPDNRALTVPIRRRVDRPKLTVCRQAVEVLVRGQTEPKRQACILSDINKLLAAFERLIDNGGTLLVIEHNLEVIRAADWIIDMGPEGGDGGGRVVAEGAPEAIAKVADSHTGRFLRAAL